MLEKLLKKTSGIVTYDNRLTEMLYIDLRSVIVIATLTALLRSELLKSCTVVRASPPSAPFTATRESVANRNSTGTVRPPTAPLENNTNGDMTYSCPRRWRLCRHSSTVNLCSSNNVRIFREGHH